VKHRIQLLGYIIIIFFCIIVNVFAFFIHEIRITKENQGNYGINIKVYDSVKNPEKYIVEIEKFREQCCWIFPRGAPPDGFHSIIYKPKHIARQNQLQFDKSGKTILELEKQFLDTAYILFDQCLPVKDGGPYFVVELSTYIIEKPITIHSSRPSPSPNGVGSGG